MKNVYLICLMRLMKKVFVLLLFSLWIGPIFALPSYYPNYNIDSQLEKILDILVEVKASKTTGTPIPESSFSTLNKNFKAVFPYFPQTPSYKLTYKQCEITTENLSNWFTQTKFMIFMDRCFEEFNTILRNIDQNYSVKSEIVVSAKNWSAPLTVTFDWKQSIDNVSNNTIPTANYYWYFTDVDWKTKLMWKGPVITHTFSKEWSYVVHLTVRSSEFMNWVFDWHAKVNINVDPKSAIISVYVMWKKLQEDIFVKVWSQEALDWVIIDWSATIPTGWRKIEGHKWTITWPNWFVANRESPWNPWSVKVVLPENWFYNISLAILDNEGNEIKKEYTIIVSDPLAIIKSNKNDVTTSDEVNFDASTSYSVSSKVKTYKWNIYDPNQNKIFDYDGKSFSKVFPVPWTYTVTLIVVDNEWNTNEDQKKIYVQSTEPIPQFKFDPIQEWKYPSQFILDATPSYDIDEINGWDSLTYEWWFSNRENVRIERTFEEWKRILVSFNEKWEYLVNLKVTDNFWKTSIIEKKINIVSTLRPKINVNPLASIWWSIVKFNVSSEKTLSYYDRDFGDWKTRNTQLKSISHRYENVWVYNVKVKVNSPSWEENEIYKTVFVWEKWYPIAAYDVIINNQNDVVIKPEWYCIDEKGKNYLAYEIDRYTDILIDWTSSVNSKWEPKDLNIYYQPKNWNRNNVDKFKYKFSELGCTYVDMLVEDKLISKISKRRIYFKVKNWLPTLTNVLSSFPQYWNESWIGMNQWQWWWDIFEIKYDPLIVKIAASWTKDLDWAISYYTWYYYKTDDPTRLLEVKITPANVPYVVFSMQRIPGEYTYWVKITDNDGWEIRSEDIIWWWPVVFFPPDSKNVDIPIVTLKTNIVNWKVWETIGFEVVSKILSERSDFKSTRVIKYDFEWDWIYDLVTKKENVEHIYTQPWTYNPKVRVEYRWYAGIWFWEKINIEKGLKASYMFSTWNNKIIIRNTSIWSITDFKFYMDLKNARESKESIISNDDNFLYIYDNPWKYMTLLMVEDEYWNKKTKRDTITIWTWSDNEYFDILSVPNTYMVSWDYNIDVGSVLDNSILYYIDQKFKWDCFVDIDISTDTDDDGNAENDVDLVCNTIWLIKYTPKFGITPTRIYYKPVSSDNWSTINTGSIDEFIPESDISEWEEYFYEDIYINFIDIDVVLPENLMWIYNQLMNILKLVPDDKENEHFKSLILSLSNSLWDKTWTSSAIIQLQELISIWELNVSQEVLDSLEDIFFELSDESTQAVLWWNMYDKYKNNILNFVTKDLKNQLLPLFKDFEDFSWDKTEKKQLLDKVFLAIVDYQSKHPEILEPQDINLIKKDLCNIIEYYDLESNTCWVDLTQETEEVVDITPKSWWWILKNIMKWIFIVLWIFLLVFIWMIVLFAIKSKKNRESWEEVIEEEDYETEEEANEDDT